MILRNVVFISMIFVGQLAQAQSVCPDQTGTLNTVCSGDKKCRCVLKNPPKGPITPRFIGVSQSNCKADGMGSNYTCTWKAVASDEVCTAAKDTADAPLCTPTDKCTEKNSSVSPVNPMTYKKNNKTCCDATKTRQCQPKTIKISDPVNFFE